MANSTYECINNLIPFLSNTSHQPRFHATEFDMDVSENFTLVKYLSESHLLNSFFIISVQYTLNYPRVKYHSTVRS